MGRVPRKPNQSVNAAQMAKLLEAINARLKAKGLPPIPPVDRNTGMVSEGSAPRTRPPRTYVPPPPPRPQPEQPPFPVGIVDPTKPLNQQELYHGSSSLGWGTLIGPPDRNNFFGYVPPPGTDLADALDPMRANPEGHLGPAVLYATNEPRTAELFGPLYRPTINADFSDFIGMNRRTFNERPGAFAKVQLNPGLLRNLAEGYGERTGKKMDPDITLTKLMLDVSQPAVTKSLLDQGVDVEGANAYLDQRARDRNDYPWTVQHLMENGGYAQDWMLRGLSQYGLTPSNNPSEPSNFLTQSRQARNAAKQAMQGVITDTGAVGITERYPNSKYDGSPQQHFGVYDKNAISSLVKLAVMLGLAQQGAGTTASGLTEE